MSGDYCTNCGGTHYGDHELCRDCRERPAAEQSTGQRKEPMGRLEAALIGAALLFVGTMVGQFFLSPLLTLLAVAVGAPDVISSAVTFGISVFVMLFSGGLAGFLRGSDLRESALTGALSGLVIAVPFALLSLGLVLLVGTMFGMDSIEGITSPFVAGAIALAIVLVQLLVAAAGCGAGGALGSKLSNRRAPVSRAS